MMQKIDVPEVSKLLSQQVDNVTCLQCCKYYILPETSNCGHTLCHICWRKEQFCPACSTPLDKKKLKVNTSLQKLTEHVQTLCETFETIYKVKLDALLLDKVVPKNDKTKDVSAWLTNSQNNFSAPAQNSQQSPQDISNQDITITSKVQVHQEPECIKSPEKRKSQLNDNVSHICTLQLQSDWDNIEPVLNPEDIKDKNKENVIGPMDIEPFFVDEAAYTIENPRRSSRKKEIKNDQRNSRNVSEEKQSINSDPKLDSKIKKVKNDWSSAKIMEKEFSKFKQIPKNKLNVSIETYKKSETSKNKTSPVKSISESIEKQFNKSVNNDLNNQFIHDDPNPNICKKAVEPFEVFSNKLCHVNEVDTVQQKNDMQILSEKTSWKNYNVESDNVTKIPFFQKSRLQKDLSANNTQNIIVDNSIDPMNSDDIVISIKVGSTVTNITIKRKENDVQLKVNTDRGIQTSLGINDLPKTDTSTSMIQNIFIKENNGDDKIINVTNQKGISVSNQNQNTTNKSSSLKKQTASLDTATAQFEITESVEKELSDIMEVVEETNNGSKNLTKIKEIDLLSKADTSNENVNQNQSEINDMDIFDSGTVEMRPVHVALVGTSKKVPSEIFVSTEKSSKKRILPEKRRREPNDTGKNIPNNKKLKTRLQDKENDKCHNSAIDNIKPKGTSGNYDLIMEQVFANIDSDIENIKQTPSTNKRILNDVEVPILKSQSPIQNMQHDKCSKDIESAEELSGNLKEKCSENIFSVTNKEIAQTLSQKNKKLVHGPETQCQLDNLLTPGVCLDLVNTNADCLDEEMSQKEMYTPVQEPDDSDKSVVEETPQKNLSFLNINSKNDGVTKLSNKTESKGAHTVNLVSNKKDINDSVISLTDSSIECSELVKNLTTIENKRHETPLTINKFVDHITHKSTPNARKLLSFDKNNDIDQTLCPTNIPSNEQNKETMSTSSKQILKRMPSCNEDAIDQTLRPITQIANNTQELQFLDKAFEQIHKTSPIRRPLAAKNFKNNIKFCVAASCLTPTEVMRIKLLCKNRGWSYVEKYVKELTHLVVGVDDENKSQRSVKYMCALAAGKWIVSSRWIEKCLQTSTVAEEEPYEVLDWTGDPGPRLSRTATKKLFEGFTFFCMPPFSVLDVETLKSMVESAGARVAAEARGARAVGGAGPALLLAEPEHTQENKFIYLAMELGIVPVNYEWVLNCLGSYSLGPVQELLLCPAALLPARAATAHWPACLFDNESQL